MSVRIDLHVHTRRHSPCSLIDPARLVAQAVKAGLDGLVITEHHYQWSAADLARLVSQANAPGFLLLAGFEYASRQGDLLFYGLTPAQAQTFAPGLPPRDAITRAQDLGAVCIAAHPTRAGMGFGGEILSLPLDAMEVRSTNLKPHEQQLALILAQKAGKRPVAASDAHQILDVGRYATEFDGPIRSMADLQEALRRGTFRLSGLAAEWTTTP